MYNIRERIKVTTEEAKRLSQRDPVTRAMAGWQPARVLMVANRLKIFTILGEGRLSAEEIAARCGTHPRSTTLLLNACVALGLLQKEKSLYRNSVESLGSLVEGKPTYLGDAINHADRLWSVWAHLEKAVLTNRPVSTPRNQPSDHGALRDFILAMHNGAPFFECRQEQRAIEKGIWLNTGKGQSYSGEEIIDRMKRVGFVQPLVIPLPPERTSLVVATRL